MFKRELLSVLTRQELCILGNSINKFVKIWDFTGFFLEEDTIFRRWGQISRIIFHNSSDLEVSFYKSVTFRFNHGFSMDGYERGLLRIRILTTYLIRNHLIQEH